MGTKTTNHSARESSQRDSRFPCAHRVTDESGTQRTSLRHSLSAMLGGHGRAVAALTAASVLAAMTEAAILAVVAQIAAALVSASHSVEAHVGPFDVHSSIGAMLAVALTLAVIRLILQLPTSFIPARIAADVQASLRNDLFDAFTRASWEAQSRDREGHLQELMTSQVLQATQGALQAAIFITSFCTFVILVGSALMLNVGVALVVLVACAVLFGLLRPLNALGARRASALSRAQMNYANGVGEAIRLAEDTHVFGVSSAQRTRVGGLTSAAQGFFFHTQLLARLVPNMYQSLIYLIIISGLGALYVAGSADVASLGAVVLLLVRAGASGQQVQGSYQYVRHAQPFIERLEQAQRAYVSSYSVAGTTPLPEVRTLAFDRVSYSYRRDRPVLSDISFEAHFGETIGIVGPSGAGKSTLVQILLNLRTPQDGRYLVNGVPVADFASRAWNRYVAYVPQEPRLVHASVSDNISFFRNIDQNAVEEAARLARIHDEIVSWHRGYDTVIGPRADAVSGGQQQRICLARALAAKPGVLVLDEPTSALDPRSETLIHESLAALKGSVTMFVVAHTMSSLDICDRVLVIVDGKLEAFDTPDALRDGSSYYRSATMSRLEPAATTSPPPGGSTP